MSVETFLKWATWRLYDTIKNSAPFWAEADFAQFTRTSWVKQLFLGKYDVNMSLSLNFDILPWGNMVLINSQGSIIVDELNIWPWSTFLCLITASRMPCYSSCTTTSLPYHHHWRAQNWWHLLGLILFFLYFKCLEALPHENHKKRYHHFSRIFRHLKKLTAFYFILCNQIYKLSDYLSTTYGAS